MKKILIVNSNYYKDISDNLVFIAKKNLKKAKFKISVLNTQGVFEIPIALRRNIKKFDGFIALGCVIKGQTPHFDLICSSTFNAIQNLVITYGKPIGNGIITALSKAQAYKRSKIYNSNKTNKGSEAVTAVISIFKNGIKKI